MKSTPVKPAVVLLIDPRSYLYTEAFLSNLLTALAKFNYKYLFSDIAFMVGKPELTKQYKAACQFDMLNTLGQLQKDLKQSEQLGIVSTLFNMISQFLENEEAVTNLLREFMIDQRNCEKLDKIICDEIGDKGLTLYKNLTEFLHNMCISNALVKHFSCEGKKCSQHHFIDDLNIKKTVDELSSKNEQGCILILNPNESQHVPLIKRIIDSNITLLEPFFLTPNNVKEHIALRYLDTSEPESHLTQNCNMLFVSPNDACLAKTTLSHRAVNLEPLGQADIVLSAVQGIYFDANNSSTTAEESAKTIFSTIVFACVEVQRNRSSSPQSTNNLDQDGKGFSNEPA